MKKFIKFIVCLFAIICIYLIYSLNIRLFEPIPGGLP